MRKLLLLLLPLLAGVPAQAVENFLVIVVDDVGVEKIGAYAEHPNAGPTPNIDQLAAEGVRFRNAWANPSCSPTRATLLTGRYGFRTGIGRLVNPSNAFALSPDETTLPELLGPGYATAALGKWHLSGDAALYGDHPRAAGGFGYYAGALHNLTGVAYRYWTRTVIRGSDAPEVTEVWPVYATRDTADEAIAQIETLPEPWLLWVAFHAAHSPSHVPPAELYPLTTTFAQPRAPTRVEQHRAMTEAMDFEIGRMLAALAARDPALPGRTTVLLVGDNGTTGAAAEPPLVPGRVKGSLHEDGIRVPLIIRSAHVAWPGGESAALVNTTDVFATVAEIAGLSATTASDSQSLLPHLLDPTRPTTRRYAYSEYFRPLGATEAPDAFRHAIRDTRYKLIRRSCEPDELYDLAADPAESTNLLDGPLMPGQTAAYSNLRGRLQEVFACDCDADADGVCDDRDNCLLAANPDQSDTDLDGFGNRCDGDHDNNGIENWADFRWFLSSFGHSDGDPEYAQRFDADADGTIGISDVTIYRTRGLGTPPGPSALACAGTVPCQAP